MLEKIDNYFAISEWIHQHDDRDDLSEGDRKAIRILGIAALVIGAILLVLTALLIGSLITS